SNLIDTLGSAEQLGDLQTLCDPALQKFRSISRNFCGARNRYDDGDIRQSVSYVCEAEVSVAIDVHLTVLADSGNVAVVRDECDPLWPATGPNEAEPSSDDRSKAVCADH